MNNCNNNQTLYEELRDLYHGAVGTFAEKIGVHRNTVKNILKSGNASPLRQDIEARAKQFIADYRATKMEVDITEAQNRLRSLVAEAGSMVPIPT